MAITTDIRFKRMQGEYQTLHDAQDELFDKVDTLESALLGLTDSVSQNGERIEALEQRIDVIDGKLDAIIKHLEVPYKPPAGFVKE
ncbi:MAG: hypothetical protein OXG23_00575 [Chloroflexi bacterium]|nr:hypothetical protein [Chloroflexota bacterium]MDE2636345.1 hypothetical protein [Chloroflexota bacterium]